MTDEEKVAADRLVIERLTVVRADLLAEREKRDEENRARGRRDLWWRLLFAVGLTVVCALLWQGQRQRAVMAKTLQEVEDCTTPDVVSPCQQRIRANQGQTNVVDGLKSDNLNASIAVGSCLAEKVPDVAGCARARYAELARPSPVP